MPLNIGDSWRWKMVAEPRPSPFYGSDGTTRGTGGEATLTDIIADGVDVSFTGRPDGGVSIELLPLRLDPPPETIRIFGALYRRVDGA